MLDLNDLQYFVMVIDHGGFAPTARALGIPKSNLSRRIALLEKRLGARLISRNTRSFRATDLGQTYYEHCRAMLAAARAAEEAVLSTRSEPSGLLRLTCPVTLLDECVGEFVTRFMGAHPQVQVHLEATDRRVDVVTEGVDIALRVRTPPFQDSDLVMRELSERVQCLVVSPTLLEQYGPPNEPSDLSRYPSIQHGQPQQEYSWTLHDRAGQSSTVPHHPRLVTKSLPMLHTAALRAVGLAKVPAALVHDDLIRGKLVEALPGWAPLTEVIHAVLPSRRGMLPSTRLLLDFISERFSLLDDPRRGLRASA